ncbi:MULTISPECIES: aromatic ring-hydroxylating oxygenase subunit alpha [unclassified Ketobacter]|uniref:aromatic ring-hydroxylating oxygenase subunit alpha n=1 Tax=unclassified Ketobacter TaxID=2639109 RepID=UPI000F1CE806|nr:MULTISPECIES: aromatic ring-hydroxylating dioxygenase subunit alpha [unclassified Ketobacter]RLT90207.1 MAG: aromatic ring-hydroxylating dioxygenase subunit alpha [Ketobacter sp. GenoA1]RLT93596.1 MAG: aromatic ring-hydroxylating dioxygenase subunit alpha [Ketobacter sp.]
MNKKADFNPDNLITVEDLSEPLTYSVEAFTSPRYAEEESDKLWAKVWQHAGRVEEIPEVGNYITYDIMDDSIIIVRSALDTIKAFYNVCSHRGRQLVDTPQGAHSACGRKQNFVCGYHGWTYNLEGTCTRILDESDWKGVLNDSCTRLNEIKVDTWGGWIWINMDPECEPLRDYLEPAAGLLDQFEFDKMRFRWRQWVVFDCNWKTALEAFMEPYHVEGTHPQLCEYGDFYAWSKAQGLHGNDGFDSKDPNDTSAATTTVTRAGKGPDARKMIAQMQEEFWDTIGASTTPTLVNAAKRLVDELPEGTPAHEVHEHWYESAKRDDAERGVIWPSPDPEQLAKAGLAWHIFPNMSFIPGLTFALGYRTRPYGNDPNKCIYESFALERFPEGQEPETEWVYAEPTEENWKKVLAQDFSNMAAVQKGMRNRGFRGTLPNPHQEQKITNFHRNLARYMGRGSPQLIGKSK